MVIEHTNLLKIEDNDVKDGVLIVPQGINYIDAFILPFEQEEVFLVKNSCRQTIETLWLPSSLKQLGKNCFSGCKKLKQVLFYDSQKDIDDYNLGKREIDYLTKYNNLEKINKGAFTRTGIKEFVVTKSMKELGEKCFSSSSLEKLEFTSDATIKTFKSSSINGCEKIKKLELPKSVEDFVIINGEGAKNLKSIKFDSLPQIRRENKSFFSNNIVEMNPVVDCDELNAFGKIELKDLFKVDKGFGIIAVTKLSGNTLQTFIQDNDSIIRCNMDKVAFNFTFDSLELAVGKGYMLKFYVFEKMKNLLNITRKIPADIMPLFTNEQDIKEYLVGSSKNKIFRKTENECIVYSKMYISTNNYMRGLVAFSFMLGAFSESESLRQKASDFIYSNVLKEEDSFKVHKLLNFDNVKIYNNSDESYYKFWRENFKELTKFREMGVDWDSDGMTRFYDYLNNNFNKIKKMCHDSKVELNVKNVVNIYNNEINLCFDKERKDISEELRNYPRTTRETVEYIHSIKKKMEKNKIGQNIFEPVNKDEIPLLYDESKLVDKLTGETSDGYKYVFINKYRTKNMTYAIDDRTGCANVFNVGMGIVASGMELDNCQNLRVFDDKGNGIARATIILDKQKGEILYNTFLVYGHTYMSEEELFKVFRAFKTATFDFIDEYEKNFPNNKKINQVNVGQGYNGLYTILDKYYTRQHKNIEGVNFSLYAENTYDSDYMYNGDWEDGQYMLYDNYELNRIRRDREILKQEQIENNN